MEWPDLAEARPWLGLAILVAMAAGFVRERHPPVVVAIVGAVAFFLIGALSTDEFLFVFSNKAPITIGAMFVLTGALARTGVVDGFAKWLERLAARHPHTATTVAFLFVTVASAFANNTAVVLVMLPVFTRLAQATGTDGRGMLMALSYLAIMGGTCTLIGTSTSLLVDGIARDLGLPGFDIFDPSPIGLTASAAGALLLALLVPTLLPRRSGGEVRLQKAAGGETDAFHHDRAPVAVGALVGVILLAALGLAPIASLAIVAVAVVLLARCLTPAEAWGSIDGNVLVLIFAMLAVGAGLREAGTLDLIVDALRPLLEGASPLLLLVLVYAITSLMTELISNNAVAAVMTPLIVELAYDLNVDATPLLLALIIGASASFATPVGYQTNTLVHAATDLRFADFLRIGIPLNIVVGATACAAIYFWVM